MSQKRRAPARQGGHRHPRKVGFWYRFGRWLGLSAQERSLALEAAMPPAAPPSADPASGVGIALAALTQRYQAALLSNPPRPPVPLRG